MSAAIELDPILKHALKLLHSPNPDSAEKIRLSLDEIIKQRHGSSKMLINTLNKKYLAEESQSPGTSVKRRRTSESKTSMGTKNVPTLSSEEITTSAESVNISINISDIKTIDVSEEENLKEFGDLACVECGALVVAPGNRLIECAECHSLYHQECHKPHISDDDANEQEYSWCCTNCKSKVISSSNSSSSSSHSGYNNNNSSGNNKDVKSNEPATSSKSSSKSSHKSSSKSKSSSNAGGNSNSSSGNTAAVSTVSSSGGNNSKSSAPVTPNINIISVDKRLQIMKKKAAKQQESKRKHK